MVEALAELGEEFEEEGRRLWVYVAAALGLTILLSTLLDRLAEGVPLGFYIPLLNEPATLSSILYHASVLAAGGYVGYVGLRELVVERRFSVEFLMAVAALGALYLDFLFEGATVLFLYSLAEYFEDYIEDRARKTVEKLSAYMPDEARLLLDGSEGMVRVESVDVGETILVRPGERIPLDGVVLEGSSYVDQSLVTGESTPLFKKSGDAIYAGTLSTDGVLRIRVTKRMGETLVSRIVKLVMQSRRRKASIERLVDRFARVYVPVVISLAAFTALLMPTLAGGAFNTWFYRALILLVVSCPSAFVLSVPATMFTAIAAAARRGVIIKGGAYVEKMARVGTVVFDKTGTLTLGRPAVSEVNGDVIALMYAAALEQYSNHPVAEAIVRKASEIDLGFKRLKVEDVREMPGKGVTGCVAGARVVVGNRELLKENGLGEGVAENAGDKHTQVYVSVNGSIASVICLVDEVRGDAVEAVKALGGDVYTAMLTGDRSEIAGEVAGGLGIGEVHAELFPEDKLRIVERLREEHGLVAMVGDGINDAPALAASDVGIAMGGGGVDIALESADIVLVKDELIKIPYLYELSSLAVKIAKQNIAVSLGVKLVLGALGFMGLVPLWFAVATGDDGVTMLLLLNTLRLTRVKVQDEGLT